jgi:hypothetical protein
MGRKTLSYTPRSRISAITNQQRPSKPAIQLPRTIHICEELDYLAEVFVDADSPNGEVCFANETYKCEINPQCKVNAELSCTVDGTNGSLQCDDSEGEQQRQ